MSRFARVWSLIALAAARSPAQSESSATAAARLTLMAPVACARLRRNCESCRAVAAASGKAGMPRYVGILMCSPARSLVHHPYVGDLGWIADAPAVPPGHRPARLTFLTSNMSSARSGGYPGRADRRQG